MITPLKRNSGHYGRVAVAYVQGSPKGAGAWTVPFQVITARLGREEPMRLQLIGNYTLKEFQNAISELVTELNSNKIETLKNVNVYFRPCINGNEIEIVEDGYEIDHVIFDSRKKQKVAMRRPTDKNNQIAGSDRSKD